MIDQRNLLWGAFLLVAASLSWGGMFPVAKSTLAVMDGFHMTAIRYGVTAVVFLVILAIVEGRAALNPGSLGWKTFLYGSAGFAGFSLLAFVGLSLSRPDHAAIIMTLQTPMTAFANWWLRGVRPPRFTLVCITFVLVGALLVVTKGSPAAVMSGGYALGDTLIFFGAASWVIYTLGSASFPTWSPLRYTALTCALGVVSVFALTGIATAAGYLKTPTLADVMAVRWHMAYMIVFASIIAVLAWNAGIRLMGALNATLTANLVPITVFAIGLAQGQRFQPVEIAGAAMVVGALVANNRYQRRAARSNV